MGTKRSGIIGFLTAITLSLLGPLLLAGDKAQHAAALKMEETGCWSSFLNPTTPPYYQDLRDITFISANDAWAVGSTDAYRKTLAAHWDGSTWTVVPTPNKEGASSTALTAVSAISHNDVWAVGYSRYGALTMHWDGNEWSIVPNSFAGGLSDVAAVSTNDVWAVGTYQGGAKGTASMILLHWDGQRWSDVPPHGRDGYRFLRSIAAVSADDVWAVGTGIWHWDGTSGSNVPTPRTYDMYGVSALGPNDVLAVGVDLNRAIALHWDGTAWTEFPSPSIGRISKATAVSANDFWAITEYTRLLVHWDGTNWTQVPIPVPTAYFRLNDLTIVDGDLWIVGSTYYHTSNATPEKALLLRYDKECVRRASQAQRVPLTAPVYISGQDRLYFPQTQKEVSGTFLRYWREHGDLPQQGYPISQVIGEVSDLDGKFYSVQYFERAVFEYHPEFAGTPDEVLLSQLGTFQYKRKYPNGAPDQKPNNDPDSVLFRETGKRLGGKFLEYWKAHGGLQQQGYPISDEFIEVSDLNGKPYLVQYFERAVFEYHPENQPPNDVLLSQLGTFRYRQMYGAR